MVGEGSLMVDKIFLSVRDYYAFVVFSYALAAEIEGEVIRF